MIPAPYCKVPPLNVMEPVPPSALALPIERIPAASVVPPVYASEAFSVRVPEPAFMSEPLPYRLPLKIDEALLAPTVRTIDWLADVVSERLPELPVKPPRDTAAFVPKENTPVPLISKTLDASEAALPKISVPPATTVLPVNVLKPESVTVPAPANVNEPAPLTIPLSVLLVPEARLMVAAPLSASGRALLVPEVMSRVPPLKVSP